MAGRYGTSNPEDPYYAFQFNDQSIRRGFIRKVYSILMVQLVITGGIMACFLYDDNSVVFLRDHLWLTYVAIGVVFTIIIALACCGEVRRKAPTNYILLGIFTIAEGFLLSTISIFYEVNEVLMAVGITAAICLALTLFAFQTKCDFTLAGGFLLICLVCLIIFGIIASIMAATGNANKVVDVVYATFGALLFSLYLVYDTQLMMGGEHQYSISPEEYIFAALNLYIDIINILVYILLLKRK